jgi:hypothetical protein
MYGHRRRTRFNLNGLKIAAILVAGVILTGNAYLVALGKVDVKAYLSASDGPISRAILPEVDPYVPIGP